jgi:hypothetical protein
MRCLAWAVTGPTDVTDCVKSFANRGRSAAAGLVIRCLDVGRPCLLASQPGDSNATDWESASSRTGGSPPGHCKAVVFRSACQERPEPFRTGGAGHRESLDSKQERKRRRVLLPILMTCRSGGRGVIPSTSASGFLVRKTIAVRGGLTGR